MAESPASNNTYVQLLESHSGQPKIITYFRIMRPEQISKKGGSKEAEGKAGRKKLQKIIIDVL